VEFLDLTAYPRVNRYQCSRIPIQAPDGEGYQKDQEVILILAGKKRKANRAERVIKHEAEYDAAVARVQNPHVDRESGRTRRSY